MGRFMRFAVVNARVWVVPFLVLSDLCYCPDVLICSFFAFIFHNGMWILMDFMNFLRNFALCFQNVVILV